MEELKNRIVGRGTESKSDIEKRYENAFKELEYIKEYEYMVINDEVMNAVEKIESIIMAEKCKTIRQKELIKKILS